MKQCYHNKNRVQLPINPPRIWLTIGAGCVPVTNLYMQLFWSWLRTLQDACWSWFRKFNVYDVVNVDFRFRLLLYNIRVPSVSNT